MDRHLVDDATAADDAPQNYFGWLHRAIVWTPRFTGALSILGSAAIIRIVLVTRRRRLKRQSAPPISPASGVTVNERLLLSMAFIDLLNSAAQVLSTAPIPRGTPDVLGAVGNTATCEAQGFLIQFGFGVPLYNCSLCLYYLLVIRHNMRETFLARWIEPALHAFALVPAVGFAVAGLCLDLFNNAGSFCYISPYPYQCVNDNDVPCERGEDAYLYQWLFSGSIVIFAFVFITGCMTTICCFVWRQERKMRDRYDFASTRRQSLASVPSQAGSSATGQEAARQTTRRKMAQTRDSTVQAGLYVGSFFATYVWWAIVGAVEQDGSIARTKFMEAAIFCLHFFLPLQGFWNAVIFMRPRYNKMRKSNPDQSRLWAAKAAIRNQSQEQVRSSVFPNEATSSLGRRLSASLSRRLSAKRLSLGIRAGSWADEGLTVERQSAVDSTNVSPAASRGNFRRPSLVALVSLDNDEDDTPSSVNMSESHGNYDRNDKHDKVEMNQQGGLFGTCSENDEETQ